MNPAYYWPHLGGMFSDAVVDASAKTEETKGDGDASTVTTADATPADVQITVPSARV
jgi:hypothetical protein